MMIGTDDRARELLAHLEAASVGQTEVEQDEIGRRCRQGGRSSPDEGHVEALTSQPGRQRLADGVVVFDDENSYVSHKPSTTDLDLVVDSSQPSWHDRNSNPD